MFFTFSLKTAEVCWFFDILCWNAVPYSVAFEHESVGKELTCGEKTVGHTCGVVMSLP